VTLGEEFCRNHLEANPGDYVLLTVGDTGHGMDDKTRQQIFDPFFSTKQPGKGTGLGLSTVYGIVTGHEGHIFCSSRPGHGTAFNIYLPALPAKSLQAEVILQQTRPQGGDERILLVDDEETLRQVGAALLKRAGYKVRTATSGEEALDIFSRARDEVDLVVLDLGMPGMGGLKCLGELLLLDPAIRVLIASGYAADGQIQQSLERGAAGYIAKPYRKGEMLAAVRRVLDQVK
jgi:two-component system, cell cycle sensor histidine kinase and response regulator CckA